MQTHINLQFDPFDLLTNVHESGTMNNELNISKPLFIVGIENKFLGYIYGWYKWY